MEPEHFVHVGSECRGWGTDILLLTTLSLSRYPAVPLLSVLCWVTKGYRERPSASGRQRIRIQIQVRDRDVRRNKAVKKAAKYQSNQKTWCKKYN
jgi:hypothetical protein